MWGGIFASSEGAGSVIMGPNTKIGVKSHGTTTNAARLTFTDGDFSGRNLTNVELTTETEFMQGTSSRPDGYQGAGNGSGVDYAAVEGGGAFVRQNADAGVNVAEELRYVGLLAAFAAPGLTVTELQAENLYTGADDTGAFSVGGWTVANNEQGQPSPHTDNYSSTNVAATLAAAWEKSEADQSFTTPHDFQYASNRSLSVRDKMEWMIVDAAMASDAGAYLAANESSHPMALKAGSWRERRASIHQFQRL